MDKNTKSRIDVINQRIKEMNSVYHIAASKSGISDGELDIWSALLNATEEYSQQDLCELLSLSKQTINSLISGFIKKGFVVLEHAPGSRNRKVIHLTESGKDFGGKNVAWIFEAEKNAMEGTNPQEIEAYITMLERYIGKLRNEVDRK